MKDGWFTSDPASCPKIIWIPLFTVFAIGIGIICAVGIPIALTVAILKE